MQKYPRLTNASTGARRANFVRFHQRFAPRPVMQSVSQLFRNLTLPGNFPLYFTQKCWAFLPISDPKQTEAEFWRLRGPRRALALDIVSVYDGISRF
jgi:hypothetical protein